MKSVNMGSRDKEGKRFNTANNSVPLIKYERKHYLAYLEEILNILVFSSLLDSGTKTLTGHKYFTKYETLGSSDNSFACVRVCVCVCVCVCVHAHTRACAQPLSYVQIFITLWAAACQVALSMGFSR